MSSPMHRKSSEALHRHAMAMFVKMPVNEIMVDYLARKAVEVIQIEIPSSTSRCLSSSPSRTHGEPHDHEIPTLKDFIRHLVIKSNVRTPTLMTTLIYLERLRLKLSPVAKGIECTVHRIFLATLILSAKFLNDSSPKNKHWADYSRIKGSSHLNFTRHEVNLMEKQLLSLLDWDLNVSELDLYTHLEPFLSPIRSEIQHKKRQVVSFHARQSAVQQSQKEIDTAVNRASCPVSYRTREDESNNASKTTQGSITPVITSPRRLPSNMKSTPPPLSAVPSLLRSCDPSSRGSSFTSLPYSRTDTPSSTHSLNDACFPSPSADASKNVRQSAPIFHHGYKLPTFESHPRHASRQTVHIADQYLGSDYRSMPLENSKHSCTVFSSTHKASKPPNRIRRAGTLFSRLLGKGGSF